MKAQFKVASILVLAVFMGFGASAQDPHFSQYNAAPLTINPAQTGLFAGSYRFTAIYRSQWGSILTDETVPMFRTFSGSFDLRVPTSKKDAIGVGLMFMNDRAGEAAFGTNNINLSFSYLKSLGSSNRGGKSSHYISAGFQGGVAFRSINYSKLRFGNQFDGSGFDPQLLHGETFADDKFTFFDIGAGVFWYLAPKKRTNFYAGFSVAHLNRPDQSFLEDDEAKLFMRYTGTGGLQVPIGDQLDLLPSFLVMSQGPAFETQVGMLLKVLFEASNPVGNAFYIGPQYRIVRGEDKAVASDALILMTRFDIHQFSLGFAYDLNFSELTAATNSRGAFEVSIIHVGLFSQRSPDFFCPRGSF
jgi:type IX secretion system PorP/SprF family membrane protein